MRATWRGREDRLLYTARRRVATAAYHAEEAYNCELIAGRLRLNDDYQPIHLDARALRHRIHEAACLGLVSRPVRDAALRMTPSWTQGLDELLKTATIVIEA